MKIVNVILTSVNGGAEKVFLDYCKILKERLGHEVYAIILENAPYSKKLDEIGVKYHKISNKFGYYDPFAICAIKEALIEFDAQVTISHAGKASILTRKAIKKSKKTIYETCVNHSNNVKRSIGANMVICVNKNIFYQVIDRGQKPEEAAIVHNAIEVEDSQKIFNTDKINFTNDEITLGMMARLDRHKGFLEALESLNQIKSKKNFKLLIAGQGFFRKDIDEKISELGLEEKVKFCGWIDKPQDFFDKIDIFLFPSIKNETFGIVLLESIKASTPVICSNDFGPQEIIRPNEDGVMLDLKPAENFSAKIASAVEGLVSNPDNARKMAKSAHERLLKRFSFDNLEMNLRDLFGKN